ncbi:MAG: GDP-mannose 4,6-dehydratase [Acidobacteria bacterium]|nr:GDP-mannose 4,6-dehydratase [Acidobacteriota bacterium]MBI3657727.1 GDP-mannose 4,6-dehydratase [Acidobacteriota bacterium]
MTESPRILITGAAGFIGSHLVEALLEARQPIIGLDNFDPFYDPAIKEKNIGGALLDANFELVRSDIRDYDSLQALFETRKIDTIIHLAARAGVRPSIKDPLIYQDVNVRGTINLLEMARLHTVRRFIFASSSSVYGDHPKTPFSESDRVDHPISPYAATKQAAELLCHTYHHLFHFDVLCLRFFTVYGPRQRPDMAIQRFAHFIRDGVEVPVFGDGQSQRDYTYIDDIVQGILGALFYTGHGFDIINLGESQVTSLIYLIRLLERYLQRKAHLKYQPEQPGDMRITYADISKAVRLLNYNPQTKIEDGIRRFTEWFLTHDRG